MISKVTTSKLNAKTPGIREKDEMTTTSTQITANKSEMKTNQKSSLANPPPPLHPLTKTVQQSAPSLNHKLIFLTILALNHQPTNPTTFPLKWRGKALFLPDDPFPLPTAVGAASRVVLLITPSGTISNTARIPRISASARVFIVVVGPKLHGRRCERRRGTRVCSLVISAYPGVQGKA